MAALIATVALLGVPQTSASAASTAAANVGLSIPGNRLLFESQAQLDVDLDRVAASGAAWLRLDLPWTSIEGTRGQPNWPLVDRAVDGARRRGLALVGILITVPTWARPAGTSWSYGPQSTQEVADFADFAYRATARYAGRIDTWEVWNEPNLDQFWSPTPQLDAYTRLLTQTSAAIRRASGTARVLAGGSGGANGSPDISSIDWYRGLYARGAAASFDAATVHPYPDMNNAAGGEMANALSIRQLMDAQGDSTKSLWGTETGAPTAGLYSTSESNQASLVTDVYRVWSGIHNHGPLFWYTLQDAGGTDREGFFGVVRADGSDKPSFAALQAYAATPVGDAVAPSVFLTAPAAGATVSGAVTVAASASDNVSVTKVDVLVDGVVQGTDPVAPFSLGVDTTRLSNGTHNVTAAATDAAGNRTVSSPRSITVNNVAGVTAVATLGVQVVDGRATFTAGLQTSGTTTVDALIVAVRDTAGVNYDVQLATATPLSGAQSFRATRALPGGTYTYRVAYRRSTTWTDLDPTKSLLVGTTPDVTAPTVTVTTPSGGAIVHGPVNVAASATDNTAVRKVDFLVDGLVKGTDTAAPFALVVDTARLTNGNHTLAAAAVDLAGNRAVSAARTVTVNNVGVPVTVTALNAQAAGGPTTFSVSLQTSGTMTVDALIVAVRDAAGGNHDVPLATTVTLGGAQSFSANGTLPAGAYTYRTAYRRNGIWTDLDPTRSVVR